MKALKKIRQIMIYSFLLIFTVTLYGSDIKINSVENNNRTVFASMQKKSADYEMVEPGVITLEKINSEILDEIKILTFNIRSANDSKGDLNLESIIKEIRETDADIIGLQEVERFMPRSGFKDQAKEIAKALGYNYAYGSNINVLGAKYGNATLSKYPIVEKQNHKLPHLLIEPRGLLEAVINIDGNFYNVFNTHLGLNERERELQFESIIRIINTIKDNVILLGDFNHAENGYDLLDKNLTDSAAAIGMEHNNTYAIKSDEPDVRIDRIYVSSDIDIKDNIVLHSNSSDHMRVITTIAKK